MLEKIKKAGKALASPDVVFFSLAALMVILIAGTISQKYIGLYQSQHMFFTSFFFWWGSVPVPSGALVMGIVFISLICKLVFASVWKKQNAGVIITHIGALLLLFGGILTAVNAEEGSMTIYEGQTTNTVVDYHEREMVVLDEKAGKTVLTVPWNQLKEGEVFEIPSTPITIEIVKACRNCDIRPRAADDKTVDEFRGRARDFDMTDLPQEKEDEKNKSGIQFKISGAGAEKDGIHFSVDFIDVAPSIPFDGKTYTVAVRKHQTPLPFSIKLLDFEKQVHPGTDIPRSYKSEVLLIDEDGNEWRSIVQMNQPLRYKGYTFYQSAFVENDGGEATVLAVVHNLGRSFPYISSILMCIGLLIHMANRLPNLLSGLKKSATAAAFLAVLLTGIPHTAFATAVTKDVVATEDAVKETPVEPKVQSETATAATETSSHFNYATFAKLPVLDQGRVKPIDTFARVYLEHFSGRDKIDGISAVEWLAEVIFTPANAAQRKIFNIPDPRVSDALGLEQRPGHHYSYKEVSEAIAQHFTAWHGLFMMDEKKLTSSQKDMLTIYNSAQTYHQLSRSLSLFFPLIQIPEGKMAEAFGVPAGTMLTYMEMQQKQDVLNRLGQEAMQRAMAKKAKGPAASPKKGEKPNPHAGMVNPHAGMVPGGMPGAVPSAGTPGLSPESVQILMIVQRMGEISNDRENMLFQVIPPQWGEQKDGAAWYSPWGITMMGQGSPAALSFMKLWKDALIAYSDADAGGWNAAITALQSQSLMMAGDAAPSWKLDTEVSFNTYPPFKLSLYFYMAGFIAVLLSLFFLKKHLYRLSVGLLATGFMMHGFGIFIRMLLMGRPPVTNLYASIVFVGLIIAFFSLLYEYRMRNRLGVFVATAAVSILQFVGIRFDSDGDTMGMLTAVLDTNFWLSTHVVMITVGYSASIICGVLAHIYLILRVLRPNDTERANEVSNNMRGMSYVALFFASVGTILGGIWADQSWGRFWGWDPKENGAMLICLWLLFVTHGRVAGRLGALGFPLAMVFINVCVALAWFGVNILSVGLHSYGFTEGAAFGLAAFCAGELAFAVVTGVLIKVREKQALVKGDVQ